jgi:hypothetical protein
MILNVDINDVVKMCRQKALSSILTLHNKHFKNACRPYEIQPYHALQNNPQFLISAYMLNFFINIYISFQLRIIRLQI